MADTAVLRALIADNDGFVNPGATIYTSLVSAANARINELNNKITFDELESWTEFQAEDIVDKLEAMKTAALAYKNHVDILTGVTEDVTASPTTPVAKVFRSVMYSAQGIEPDNYPDSLIHASSDNINADFTTAHAFVAVQGNFDSPSPSYSTVSSNILGYTTTFTNRKAADITNYGDATVLNNLQVRAYDMITLAAKSPATAALSLSEAAKDELGL